MRSMVNVSTRENENGREIMVVDINNYVIKNIRKQISKHCIRNHKVLYYWYRFKLSNYSTLVFFMLFVVKFDGLSRICMALFFGCLFKHHHKCARSSRSIVQSSIMLTTQNLLRKLQHLLIYRFTDLPNFLRHETGNTTFFCCWPNKVVSITTTVLFVWRKNVDFEGMIARFRDFFHIYVNEGFILEEKGKMLNEKTYVNASFTLTRLR